MTPARLVVPPGVRTQRDCGPVVGTKVPPLSAVGQLSEVLDSPEIAALVSELETTRWTGRPGYPIRSMVGMALTKSIYAVPTWTRTVALVREHAALSATVAPSRDVPSVYACYRFTAKLRAYSDLLARCIDRVTVSVRAPLPDYGRNVAIDGSDMPAYANGQRYVSKSGPERERFSDPDASWRTAPPSRRARVAGSTATRSTLPSAPRPTFPSRGTFAPPATTRASTRCRSSTRPASAVSRSRRPRWTRAMT